mmetsp:Transcript_2322/g.3198  ORF Transcript_2322/g.3198 Transcript_2322/m.3198 type:complete len:87 (+) Transcript_2322:59-319(+)
MAAAEGGNGATIVPMPQCPNAIYFINTDSWNKRSEDGLVIGAKSGTELEIENLCTYKCDFAEIRNFTASYKQCRTYQPAINPLILI